MNRVRVAGVETGIADRHNFSRAVQTQSRSGGAGIGVLDASGDVVGRALQRALTNEPDTVNSGQGQHFRSIELHGFRNLHGPQA